MTRFRLGCFVLGLALSSAAFAQDTSTCATSTTNVALESIGAGENAFFYGIRGYAIEFRPDAVIDFWTNGLDPDPGLVEILSNELPLRDDANLERFIDIRLLQRMVADLVASGRAAIRSLEGNLLQFVDVTHKGGRPCNSSREFRDPGNGMLIFHWTSHYR
jgi:hypothetical protein